MSSIGSLQKSHLPKEIEWEPPYSVLQHMFSFLSPNDQAKGMRVCKEWKKNIKRPLADEQNRTLWNVINIVNDFIARCSQGIGVTCPGLDNISQMKKMLEIYKKDIHEATTILTEDQLDELKRKIEPLEKPLLFNDLFQNVAASPFDLHFKKGDLKQAQECLAAMVDSDEIYNSIIKLVDRYVKNNDFDSIVGLAKQYSQKAGVANSPFPRVIRILVECKAWDPAIEVAKTVPRSLSGLDAIDMVLDGLLKEHDIRKAEELAQYAETLYKDKAWRILDEYHAVQSNSCLKMALSLGNDYFYTQAFEHVSQIRTCTQHNWVYPLRNFLNVSVCLGKTDIADDIVNKIGKMKAIPGQDPAFFGITFDQGIIMACSFYVRSLISQQRLARALDVLQDLDPSGNTMASAIVDLLLKDDQFDQAYVLITKLKGAKQNYLLYTLIDSLCKKGFSEKAKAMIDTSQPHSQWLMMPLLLSQNNAGEARELHNQIPKDLFVEDDVPLHSLSLLSLLDYYLEHKEFDNAKECVKELPVTEKEHNSLFEFTNHGPFLRKIAAQQVLHSLIAADSCDEAIAFIQHERSFVKKMQPMKLIIQHALNRRDFGIAEKCFEAIKEEFKHPELIPILYDLAMTHIPEALEKAKKLENQGAQQNALDLFATNHAYKEAALLLEKFKLESEELFGTAAKFLADQGLFSEAWEIYDKLPDGDERFRTYIHIKLKAKCSLEKLLYDILGLISRGNQVQGQMKVQPALQMIFGSQVKPVPLENKWLNTYFKNLIQDYYDG